MAYANYRRTAVSSQPTVATKAGDAASGSAERRALVRRLSPHEALVLRELAAANGHTEADEYLVYECRLAGGASDRTPLETDTAPRLVVERIVGGSATAPSGGAFYLPVRAIHRPEWRKHMPLFDTYIISTARFPRWDELQRRLLPRFERSRGDVALPSHIDHVETYFGALAGTLGEYYRHPTEAVAHNLWRLLRTVHHVIDNDCPTPATLGGSEAGSKGDKLAALIENRDRSRTDADDYRRFLQNLPPAHYYALLYRLMVERPELVHRSRFGTLDNFLFGLLTQHRLAASDAATMSGIEDHVLRMVMERAMKLAKRRTLKDFADRDALVQFLHESAGKQVEDTLRYWTFVTEATRTVLLLGPDAAATATPKAFAARLRAVHDSVATMGGGLTPFCLRISRDAERYLTDAALAEFVLAASQCSGNDRKFTVLLTTMFVSHAHATPRIDAVIAANTKRAAAFQAEMAATKVTDGVVPLEGVWDDFVARAVHAISGTLSCSSSSVAAAGFHVHDSVVSERFKAELVRFALEGSEQSLLRILALLEAAKHATKTPALGPRRASALLIHAAPRDSVVFAHFAQNYRPKELVNLLATGLRASERFLLNDATRPLRPRKAVNSQSRKEGVHGKGGSESEDESEGDATVEAMTPDDAIVFVKFELARERVVRELLALATTFDALPIECFICFEERAPAAMCVLHGETRHTVCSSCRPALKACPFCRATL